MAGHALELRLPVGHFYHRTVNLPNAGRDYLRPILDHSLERLTPWRRDDVLYGFEAEAQPTGGTIAVQFMATSASRLAPILAQVEAAGLVPTGLGSAGDPLDRPLRIDLYKGRAASAPVRLRRHVVQAVLVLLFTLALTASGSFWFVSVAEEDAQVVEARLAVLNLRIRQERKVVPDRTQALIEARRHEQSPSALIDRLSAALPDHTVLRELEIAPDRVRLAGHSSDASALVGLLEAEAGLSGVRFGAPVTRDAGRRDVFEIVAMRGSRTGAQP
ncbi:PilN domain-containing protein [Methylobacterium nigriterrae]|uniref:PilN domain-containing protein n=1 Tax=Methylobacterium nigriterrae TaxID=3127512 RepID=UPI003013BEC8